MGRSGTLWAHQQVGVQPDLMTVAKGLGGGLPIGACVSTPRHVGIFELGDHGSTFAGGPVIAAAANAVLDTVDDEDFLAAVRSRGARLAEGLRAAGLAAARGGPHARLPRAHDAPELARRLLLEERLVTNATGPDTLRLLPPLTVSEAEVDEALGRIARVLGR